MEIIADIVRTFLPGSLEFLWLMVLVALVLLLRGGKEPRAGRTWLICTATLYFLFALPPAVRLLESGLDQGYTAIQSATDIEDIDAILVLGGGSQPYRTGERVISVLSESSSLRVIEGARLYELLKPVKVIVSGGLVEGEELITPESEALKVGLISLGVDAEDILLESFASSTHQHPEMVAQVLDEHGMQHFILVTSPAHMDRAMDSFLKAGLDPIPSVSGWHTEEGRDPREGWLPNTTSLYASKVALREYLARVFYRLQGW